MTGYVDLQVALNDDSAERAAARQKRKQEARRRSSFGILTPRKGKSVANVPATPKVPTPVKLTTAELAQMHDRVNKLAAENKITTKNTWNLSLIDHIDGVMADIFDPSNADGAGNFLKASCTLTASVMIYSCRVDDVHQDTFRVLGGLNRAGRRPDAPEPPDETEEPEEKKRKKTVLQSHTATLESNPANLNVRQFDLRFDVDPLFAKTSAAFDEGGAKGLLLGHLGVLPNGALASDGNEPAEAPPRPPKSPGGAAKGRSTISLPWSVVAPVLAPNLKMCPAMADFSFKESTEFIPEPARELPEIDDADFGVEADFGFDDDDDGGGADAVRLEAGLQRRLAEEEDGEGKVTEVVGPAVPAALDFEMVLSAAAKGMREPGSHAYHFVDPKLMQNWAGPSHWRFAPAARIEADEAAKKAPRAKKEPFMFDFSAEPVDPKVAFTPATGRASTVLSAAVAARSTAAATALLLPVDLHYSVKELTRLFSQPSWAAAKMHREGGRGTHGGTLPAEDGGDADADDVGDVGDADGWYDYDNAGDTENFVPNIQAPEGEALDVLQAPRQVDQIKIDYAKHAKQVNVQRLKEGIWDSIEKKDEEQSFRSVVSALPKSLPSEELRDVTVPFCFICLLHLANEKGLEIRSQEDMTDLKIVRP